MHPNTQHDLSPARPKLIAFIAFFIPLLSFFTYVVMTYFSSKKNNVQDAIVANRHKKLEEVNQKQHHLISTYEWVDKDKGVVRIPVERAEQIILQELNQSK